MAVTYLAAKILQGLEADTKPTNVPSGSIFRETDTNGTEYIYDGSTWQLRDPRGDSAYVAYIAGSTVKIKNNATQKIDYSGTTVHTVLQSALDAIKNTGKRLTLLSGNTFTLTSSLALGNSSSLAGESGLPTQSRLHTTADIPLIVVSEPTSGQCRLVEISNLYLTHNNASFTNTKGLVSLETTAGHVLNSVDIHNCYFYDFDNKRGAAIKFNNNDAAIYKVAIYNCEIYGFNDQIYVNSVLGNANSWINSNTFTNINHWMAGRTPLTVSNLAGGGEFSGNQFINCITQVDIGNASSEGYDLDGSSAGLNRYNSWTNCMLWDLAGTKDAWKFNTNDEATLTGCTPTYRIGGGGATSGKIARFDTFSRRQGTHTASGNGSTKAFSVTTGLTASGGTVTPTLSYVNIIPKAEGAMGYFYITSTDASAFTVNYAIAPPTGASNIVFYWEARI